MIGQINTVQVARTDAQIERAFADGGLGLDINFDDTDGFRAWFRTTQPGARLDTDLQVGDDVTIVAMSDDGALGKGSTYIGEIEDIDQDMSLAWVVGR